MTYTFIAQRCSDLPVAACCRAMGVSTSGFYAWQSNPVSDRDWNDANLTNTMFDIHRMSRRSYGSPRVHAELVLGQGQHCSRKRVARLMVQAGIVGIRRRKFRGCTKRDPDATPAEDLVKRDFNPSEPDRRWVMDVTEHSTGEGKVYLAVVLDAWSRRVVGWSIADHIRSELVVDAVQMAIWRRQPPKGRTVAHSEHGSQGEFERSSQHLRDRGARDGSHQTTESHVADAGKDALSGTTTGLATRPGRQVLGGDRQRRYQRGGRDLGRGGIRRWHQVVP
jgi:putative transposase